VFAASDLKAGRRGPLPAATNCSKCWATPTSISPSSCRTGNIAGILYADEVRDACEDDSLGYQIDNIRLSDFVYPSWFESFRTEGSIQFDRMNKIQAPLQLLAGGYLGSFNVTSGSGCQATTAEKHPTSLRNRGSVGTRRQRRNIPHDLWINSLPQRKTVGNAQIIGNSCKPFSVDTKLPKNFQWVFLDPGARAQCAGPFSRVQRSPSYIGKRFSLESS
jgi:hypothetical protein